MAPAASSLRALPGQTLCESPQNTGYSVNGGYAEYVLADLNYVGLPPGEFPTPIFDVVLKAISISGSIVGTRADLQEALDFAAEGLVKATIHSGKLENINQILGQLRAGQIEGRVVLEM